MAKAYVYDVLKHGYDRVPRPDSIQNVPNIVVCAYPFKYPNTYGLDPRFKSGSGGDVKDPKINISKALETTDPVLIEGITKATVSTSKRAHTASLQVECIDKNDRYLNLLTPGDWIVCSMFTDPATYKRIKEEVVKKVPGKINGFDDGLKFIGRVQTVRRFVSTNPQNGAKIRRVTITAVAFGEFDSSVYFDPALDYGDQGLTFASMFFGRTISDPNKLMNTSDAIPALITALLGRGPGKNSKYRVEHITTNTGAKEEKMQVSPNAAFNIPSVVARLLGVQDQRDPNRQHYSFSDALTCIFGIQKYDGLGFMPTLSANRSIGRHYQTPYPIRGEFPPMVVPWVNVPIWGVLNTFLMPVVNEMYTCMRPDKNRDIMPTFVARQIPFNTDHIADYSSKRDTYTTFSSLPRWKIDPMQVLTDDTSKSNSLRCNYVQVKPQAAIQMVHDEAWARGLVNPRWDSADISRNGVFPHFTTCNLLLNGDGNSPTWWAELATDRDMNGHMKLSGQIVTMGIQDPICEGDNVEYENAIFHIEAVQHTFVVNPITGAKTFQTILVVSNGVPVSGFPYRQADLSDGPQTTLE